MPHPRRFDFDGAIHLLRLRARAGAYTFVEPEVPTRPNASRAQAFMRFLQGSLDSCGSRLFGYHLDCDVAVLLLQTGRVPLERLMQRVCGAYGRYWRELSAVSVAGETRGPFSGRYDSKVIAPEYLPHALRRLHRMAAPTASYPFSSQQAYFGTRSTVRIAMGEVFSQLTAKGLPGVEGYREFMRQPESAHVALLFAKGSPHDRHIVGNRSFVLQARDAAAHPQPAPSREQLMAAVARRLGKRPEEIRSGQREGVLARSIVAWHALRTGAATVTQVGNWFSVSGATVGRGLHFYRRAAPQYFNSTLPGLNDEPDT